MHVKENHRLYYKGFFFLTNMALTLSAISERIICGHLFNYVKIAMLLSFREI